jgi:Carboxypeptidase regulatory-like domain
MGTFARIILGAFCLALVPVVAAAQTSTIAGTVKDVSGAILPGVTVEVTSPALIEKVRSAISDGSGQYQITQLRPGTYTVTFTLPGFTVVKREGVELTSDFTATINADMKVGAVEETITVSAESPIVDVSNITSRTVMTRDVLDAIPTGRNIQAVGIMIPGTTIAVGGGGALSRDVGGSGNLQQSPLQYRGSTDTVQTIDGVRLNNLCAQGAYSGVYWNDASFQEISYVTGADSAEMGQGGIRVNMVPRDGGNSFRGSVFGNYADGGWAADNLRSNLAGDTTFNANNRLTNVGVIKKVWDFNPSVGGPIKRDKIWFNFTFRHWGVNKTVADSFFDLDPSPFRYVPDPSRQGVDDGHIVSRAGRVAWQISQKDKLTVYHDDQNKYRDHWGISANVPPEASAIQVTPTSFVDVAHWTRTHTNRLLFDAGVGIYDQEYTELYQPGVTGLTDKVWDLAAIQNSKVYTVCDNSTGVCSAGTGKIAGAWNNPADHFSLLRTFSGSASYITGSHSMRFGAAVTNGRWRLVRQWTGDMQPIEFTNGLPTAVTLRLPTDRRNGIKADTGIFAQDKWTVGRATVNAGLRYDWFIGESLESDVLPSRFNSGQHYGKCADGKNDPKAGCVGTVQDWKDISPRVGVALDLFGDGRTALKASVARYVAGQQIAVADDINPVSALSITDRRPWTNDADRNGLPLDANGNIQFNELGTSTSTSTFGRNVSTTSYDPDVLNGWFKRGYNWEYTVAAQHQLAPRVSVNGGWFRRSFGNQTFTDDLRFDKSSYDGPFCVNAPSDPNLTGGGGFQACNLYDLKPSVFALGLPANNLVTFSKNFGGETNIYQGFDVNLESRFSSGAFIRGGITAVNRTFDNCNLQNAGYDAVPFGGTATVNSEAYADGTSYCHREYPYRPDMKILGSYTLPWDVQFSGTYQFTRGVQTGGTGPAILATWAVASAQFASPAVSTLGRALNAGSATKNIQLIREGLEYGDQNLHQLDLRASKRFRFSQYRVRFDFDLYNLFNSNWPYTVNTTFSTAATSSFLRPTNVLQSRFFKIGAQFDF